jgi:hypothetical protein
MKCQYDFIHGWRKEIYMSFYLIEFKFPFKMKNGVNFRD